MKRVLGILFGVLLFVAAVSASAFAAQYTITDIGGSAYPQITPTSINNSGQVVGYFMGTYWQTQFPEYHRFLWTAEDGMIETELYGLNWGINSSGEIAGQEWSPHSIIVMNPDEYLIWSFSTSFGVLDAHGTTIQQIGEASKNTCAAAFGVNDCGEAVGIMGTYESKDGSYIKWIPDMLYSSTTVTYPEGSTSPTVTTNSAYPHLPYGYAFLDNNGTIVNLSSYLEDESGGPSYSVALGINDPGDIVGTYFKLVEPLRGVLHAFLYTNGIVTDIGNQFCDGYCNSIATAINARNQVVGTVYTGPLVFPGYPFYTRAFLYQSGTVTYLTPGATGPNGGDIVGQANGINEQGTVVGYYVPQTVGATYHAFIWTKASGSQDLNDLLPANSGWYLEDATGINDSGQIVGYGTYEGSQHGFLLTPITTSTSSN